MARSLRSSRCQNEKGFVLTTDVAVSIAIVGLILLTASQFKPADVLPEIEARRMASDIVAILDYSGVLATYDKGKIEANISGIIPPNLNMSMSIKKFNSTSLVSQLQINANITKNYVSGKWWYATDKGQFFYTVDYRVGFI